MKASILKMIEEATGEQVSTYLPENVPHDDWDLQGLREYYMGWLIGEDDLDYNAKEIEDLEPEFAKKELFEKAQKLYDRREEEFTPQIMRELERVVLLRTVDKEWMDHIDAMEQLQEGIRLRAYAQQDPVVEYRLEGFDMFDSMIAAIREQTAKAILTVRLRTNEAPKREQVAKETGTGAAAGAKAVKRQPQKKAPKPGRNDPCPCGSGKKYKKCCGRDE